MKVRSAAAQVIARLLNQQGSLSSLLPEAAAKVSVRDRALLQELCYGTCRWQPRLQCYLDQLLGKPLRNKDRDVQGLLLVGLYQLVYTRIPDHAAISATVDAARALKKPWATKLLNGVLRGYQRQADALEEALAQRKAFAFAHPPWLISAIEKAWPEEAEGIFAANNLHPPFTLRVNRSRISREDYLALLHQHGLEASASPVSADGVTLSKAVDAESLPGFSDGWVSVQDEAAQLCAPLLELEGDLRILDACCAPGGKTAHILEWLARDKLGGKMVGVDISEQRLQRSRDNLQRLRLAAEFIAADASQPASWWQGPQFDRVLVDAPCSATGVIRRHPDIKLLRQPADVDRLAAIQQAILRQVWPLLKPGGLLLYATCSILPQENVQAIGAFLNQQNDAEHLPIAAEWGLAQTYGRQLLPQPGGHDGFYFARLRKKL